MKTALGSWLLLASLMAAGLLDGAAYAQSKSNGVGNSPTFTGDATADQLFVTNPTTDANGINLVNRVRVHWNATGVDTAGGVWLAGDSVSDGLTIGGTSIEFFNGAGLTLSSTGLHANSGSMDIALNQNQSGRSIKVKVATGATGAALIAGSGTADATSGVAAVNLFDVQTGIGGTPASKFLITGDGHVATTYTDASGSPGNATINKMAGKVAVLNGAAAVTVTNALVSANSNVLVTLQESDVTCTEILRAVPVGGSFTVTLNAVCTADTNVGFVVFN